MSRRTPLVERIVEVSGLQRFGVAATIAPGADALTAAVAAHAETVFVIDTPGAIPLEDSTLDLVSCHRGLHGLRDADKRGALAEAHRVLRPGGKLVFGDVMLPRGPLATAFNAGRSVSPRWWVEELHRTGFTGIYSSFSA